MMAQRGLTSVAYNYRHVLLSALILLALFLSGGTASDTESFTLVQLTPDAPAAEASRVVASGATVVSSDLRAYRAPADVADRLVLGLQERGFLRSFEPDREVGQLTTFNDPLSLEEWWHGAIGIDGLVPPGPGRPVTIVDSGIDVTHPEFAGRAETFTVNAQEPAGFGGEHGTGVASVIGATENGVGIVGIYPQAVIRSWDAAVGEGTQLTTSAIVQGLEEAARNGQGVINLSLGSGGRSPLIEQAVYEAIARGSLVVAASGNDGDRGNALTYPAALPHVLTVGATDRGNNVAGFSSRSRFVDMVAPGAGITVASARSGFLNQSGTSFAAPFVAGAAAWVWTVRPELTNTQLFEIMRRSATDIGAPGRDPDSGFGLLHVGNALAYEAPAPDPLEPNDDIEHVKPDGFFAGGGTPLTTKAKQRATISARMDAWEDPRDVYRIWIPAKTQVFVSTGSAQDINIALWGADALSVKQRADGQRIGSSAKAGTGNERIRVAPAPKGRWAYLDIFRGRGVSEAEYNLAVTAKAS